ncbi:hypothetical protein [Saccharolobus shibatae]|uniref:Uncharacterized protein n=1 Tax=Saccharolobus shibatae TaxID=2286 RepID=A0A8F5BVP8_9CREN|nr:hypothetical protein [Saccharolobus shibatae]QXJ32156.1 hypothetical protein J5U21_01807 [Saccharolobus shibatae]QXJ35167.1 hypothetical protein J5U22_01714 [Saccharolobus shibatae]
MKKESIEEVDRYYLVKSLLAVAAIALLALFPLGIYIGAALLATGVLTSTTISASTAATLAGVFLGGAGASAGLSNVAYNGAHNALLGGILLGVGIALLATGLGFG